MIELLAPAGDLYRAKIALKYGADAVYVGGKRFSLRARASNFDLDAIKDLVDFAHPLNKRVYVTVNMMMHQSDVEGLDAYLVALDAIGVDAIIVASAAIAARAQSLNLQFEVHLSTQLSLTNSQALRFFENLGISRVVLARELNLEDIQKFSQSSPVELEVFIHGGMCVNFSGRCTLSNEMTLRDANRGGCAQSCRWSYALKQADHLVSLDDVPFTMGSKDLMALAEIRDLKKLGVKSLKIEGRMKSAYYIAVIVKAYRQWLDALEHHHDTDDMYQRVQAELQAAETRPTFSGFLKELPRVQGQIYHEKPEGVQQNYIGSILEVKGHDVLIELRNKIEYGQTLEWFSPDQDPQRFTVDILKDETGNPIEKANVPMQKLWISLPFKAAVDDFIRTQETT